MASGLLIYDGMKKEISRVSANVIARKMVEIVRKLVSFHTRRKMNV